MRLRMRAALVALGLLVAYDVRAGTGSLDGDAQTIDLTVLLRYPPPQADVAALAESAIAASATLCDVTEGQLRLGTVTLRASALGCEDGDCQTGYDEADIVMSSTNSSGAGASSFCPDPALCVALGDLGANITLSRYYLERPTVWAHEIGHYALGLVDTYEQYQCREYRPPYGQLFVCDTTTATTTSLMLAQICGDASAYDYTELTTAATLPARGQASCADANDVFTPGGSCAADSDCDDLGGYGAEYDGFKNEEATTYPLCNAFDPATCEYAWSSMEWWSLYKFGAVLDEMRQVALTLEAVNGGPVFTSVTTDVPNAGVPGTRQDFCDIEPTIVDEIDVPNQVMLVLDRSWSMAFPDSDFEKCDPVAGCPEICGNEQDDDGDLETDEEDCATPRIEKLRDRVLEYLDLVAAVPQEEIEVGMRSFACSDSDDVSLREVTAGNVTADFEPAIQDLHPGGGTAIIDALRNANDALDGASKAILLVTDGFNSCGDTDLEAAITELEESGTRVYAIAYGPGLESLEVAEIAGGTHGRLLGAPGTNALGPVFARQWASFVEAGVLIPQLPYRLNRFGTTEPPNESRTPSTWAAGDDAPPGNPGLPYRTNTFETFVEAGTEKLLVLLSSDHHDVAGFGVRALLTGPPGPNPTAFDSAAPAANPLLTVTERDAYLLVEIEAPNPGAWRIEVSASSDPSTDALQTGFVTVTTRSPDAKLSSDIDRVVVVDPTGGVRVGAHPRLAQGRVFAAALNATLVRPDASTAPLAVLGGVDTDDYRVLVPEALIPQAGRYEVRLHLMASAGSARVSPGEYLPDVASPTFERTASETFVVASGTSVCPCGTAADCDGDGLLESNTADGDGDGVADACDSDSDGDEIDDAFEDGVPNATDPDADNDGVFDADDPAVDPLAPHHRVVVEDAAVDRCAPSATLHATLSSDEPVRALTIPIALPPTLTSVELVDVRPGPDVPPGDIASFELTLGPPAGTAIAELELQPGAALPPGNNLRVLAIDVLLSGPALASLVPLCPEAASLRVARGATSVEVEPEVFCGAIDTELRDADADGVGDDCDNCRHDVNRSQDDLDEDGRGDVCDPFLSACANGVDDDGDGDTDAPADLGCASRGDVSEHDPELACDNGLDDDFDGHTDLDDPGCPFPYASPENPPCNDGIDNDGDGDTDFEDSWCTPSWPYWETAPCGLGVELALAIPLLSLLRRRRRLGALAVLLGLGLARGADAFTMEFAGFEPSGDEFVGCGLQIGATTLLIVVDPPEAPGLAVSGGPSDLMIDGNESVAFEFVTGPATSVRYTVSAIAFAGGASIEAYDAELDLIGSVEVSGLGEKNVSALFGDVPLGGFRVTNSVGGHRIGSVTFEPPDRLVTVDMRGATDTQTPSLQHCGVGVDSNGTGDLYVSHATGIGVGGLSAGVSNDYVEVGESLVVELDERSFDLSYAQTSSGVSPPEVEITGFGVDGGPIGTATVEDAGPIDVSALFPGAPLTGFALAPLAGDLALLDVTIVPEPGAAATGLAAVAGLAFSCPGRSRS